jgi:putative ABC transport system permease protein
VRASRWADALWRDLRYALRGLCRSPLFTLVAVATLAIGAGANTAVFGVIDGVLLKPLPYPNPDQLVAVWHDAPGAPGLATVAGGLRLSPSMLVTYQDENRSFEHIGTWQQLGLSITGLGEPDQVRGVLVTEGVLEALAVPPLIGRWLDTTDQAVGGPLRIMLAYGYWQRRFGGDPGIIGRSLTVSGTTAEVVGVMPKGFRVLDFSPDVILPQRFQRTGLIPPPFCCSGIARLKPSVTIEQANADIGRMLPLWLDRFPFQNGTSGKDVYLGTWRITPAIRPLKQDVVGDIGNVLWVVMATIGIVLLIACTNVANLLLVRAEKRRREVGVRVALGAGPWPIVRALMLEGLLLGLAGGAVGLVLAQQALVLIRRLAPTTLPRIDEIVLDDRALVFTLAVSVFAGCVLGLIPAWRQAQLRAGPTLRSGQRGGTQGRSEQRTQNALVVSQVALALVLLVSSALMIRTFATLRTVDPGFTGPDSLQIVRVAIPPQLEPDGQRVARMENAMADAIAAIPGVSSAGFVSSMPMEGLLFNWDGIEIEGQPRDASAQGFPLHIFKSASPGLFRTTGTRVLAGRDLTWSDVYEDHRVALVSESLAKELWGGAAAAVGQRIRGPGGGTPWREVIGVVQDTHDNGLQEAAPTIVYWPPYMKDFYRESPDYVDRFVTFVARTPQAGTQALIRQIQQAVWSVNGDLPVAGVRTMREVYDRSLARTSFTLVLLGIAGSAALVLGVIGLYGVIAYAVSQRRREVAIRLALGAPESRVIYGFVRQGVALAAIGIAAGLAASAVLTRLMSALLFGIAPVDLPTYAAVAAVLAGAAVTASYVPARRAARIDPAEALAAE